MKEQDFRDLYVGRAPALRRTAFLLCGDWQLAEDLVQVAFEKVYASWSRLREPEAVLRRTLVRCWVDETRRPHRRERPVADVPDRAVAPPERESLAHALAAVPPRQRACLVLRFYDDLGVAETARLLGCTEGTVKSQTSRGLEALRLVLGEPREALL
ncbi:MAG TPA: SigE family RNA polymerase sigma factor [Mycobacteriales bacterium]|nr:SigE family RNA polymerase sigma factor [Mycobacteriales bacterium]